MRVAKPLLQTSKVVCKVVAFVGLCKPASRFSNKQQLRLLSFSRKGPIEGFQDGLVNCISWIHYATLVVIKNRIWSSANMVL